MIENFSDISEISKNRFADSPLGQQIEDLDLEDLDLDDLDLDDLGLDDSDLDNSDLDDLDLDDLDLDGILDDPKIPDRPPGLEDQDMSLEDDVSPENIKYEETPYVADAPTETVDIGDTGDTTDVSEVPEKKGGSYKDVRVEGEGNTYEVHHMPADSASNLERDDGPAIKMEKEDHRKTASCGMSREAQEYRAQQHKLIEQGKFREALQMDIDDIHDKFGDKYDDAIAEMLEYVDKLEQEGKI